MLKKQLLFVLTLFIAFGASAQLSLKEVLEQVEVNNATLSAKFKLFEAQSIEEKVGNSLSDPEVEFIPLGNKDINMGKAFELSVVQEFDFPTVYSNRNQLAKLRSEQYKFEYDVECQQILLDAYLTCIEISALQEKLSYLDRCMDITENLKEMSIEGVKKGDLTKIDENRARLEHIAARNAYQLAMVDYLAACEKLKGLNGGVELDFDGFPVEELPKFKPLSEMQQHYMTYAPELMAAVSQSKASKRDVKLSRSLSLPKVGLGYKQDKGPGEKALHGLIVSASIPLFGNKNNVKRAKAQSVVADAEIKRTQVDINSTLVSLYKKADVILETIDEYRDVLEDNNTLEILSTAVNEGRLTISEYYAEELPLHETSLAIIDLYAQYHTIFAEVNTINLGRSDW